MEKNIKIVLDDTQTNQRIQVNLEEDFDNLEILSLKISSSDVYRKSSSDFGTIVGRVQTTNGYGLQNARISIFVPITADDKLRPEITELYPFETVNDQFPNGVRYNLLPRKRNENPSHRAVGNLPDINDFVHYPQYVEIMEKYYKYTAITNDSGDYMIFGVPVGSHNIMMDFDLFDTKSFELSADDLVETTTQHTSIQAIATANGTASTEAMNQVPNFIYQSDGTFNVEVKTNINEMPNIFNEVKQVNVSPFWGDDVEHDVGITRCDFKVNYKYTPTAIFFGWAASPSAGYYIDEHYNFTLFADKPLELFGNDTSLNRDTGEVWPLNDMIVVVYRLDDKLTPGSRVRVGAFKAGTNAGGVFRIALPMYMDYYKLTQFGDLVPTDDTENGIPTKGCYAFELYDKSEAWQTRIPWGGYKISPIPGIRIPASSDGDPLTGGWEGTKTGLFEYDLINRRRKFYTIKTKYNKHRYDNVSIAGSELAYFPTENPNKDIEWNFPLNRADVPYVNDVEIIGSALIPRYSFDFSPGFDFDKIDYKNENYDKNYNPYVIFPRNIINYIWVPEENSYNEKIKNYEYHLGIGVGLFGLNQGKVFSEIFSGNDFLDYQTKENFYGDSRTYNFGDNADGPLNLSLFAIELAKNPDATTNDSGVHGRFTQAYNPTYTFGPFLSSTATGGKASVLETSIYDITDELKELIDNKVYTSYGFYTGNAAPTTFNPDVSNRYNGNYYYFGYWDGANGLRSIEKNYFTNNE